MSDNGLPTIGQNAEKEVSKESPAKITKAASTEASQAPAQAPAQAPVKANVPSTEQKAVNTHTEHLARIEAEKASIELESAKLKLDLDKANLIDMRERLAERELKRDQVRQDARTKGATLDRTKSDERKQQARCNHKKGGNGAAGIVGGQGDDSQYSVLKHKFANGDMWIRCLRCGKTWKPPVLSDYVGNMAAYEAKLEEYKLAVNFQTRNVASGGVIFGFSDGGEYYREQTKNADLR